MEDAKQTIKDAIRTAKRSMIWIEELEAVFLGRPIQYESFALAVLELENEGLLQEVKSAGRRGKQPSLAQRYRINKLALTSAYHKQLHHYRFKLHTDIRLDRYYALDESVFMKDLPWLRLISDFLGKNALPLEPASLSERSLELVGDEKWITESGGKALLERAGLWDKLTIEHAYDPLMMGVNTSLLLDEARNSVADKPCRHLIVENKTTFHALLPGLEQSGFHTLIYGCGNKITGNIEMFPLQFPLGEREQRFYYFGDLDYAGIAIWHDLNMRQPAIPALPFYEASLALEPSSGKLNQRRNEMALQSFLSWLPSESADKLGEALAAGLYYPQELLSAARLKEIWRFAEWK